jgi:Fe2+ or Zn2+ uptake regulation protein
MAVKTWNPHPLSTVIVELLQHKGSTTDMELYDMVKEVKGNLGFNVVNRELLRLEIKGVIHVSALSRGKRRVEVRETSKEGT